VWEILSLAQHTFRESLRKKVMLVIGLFIIVVLVSSTLAPAEYPGAKVRLAMTVAFKSMALFGLVSVVFLAATSIPDDIQQRTAYTLLTKPVTRLQFVLGRTLGFVFVATALLTVMGVFSWAFIHYMASTHLSDRFQQAEFLAGRRFIKAQAFHLMKGSQVLEREPTAEGQYWVYGPLDVVGRFTFMNLLPEALWADRVYAEMEFLNNAQGVGGLRGVVTVMNPSTGDSEDISVYYASRKVTYFGFPSRLIDARGTVVITVRRTAEGDALGITKEDMRIRLQPVGFAWNLTKMMVPLLLGLTVAAALAVMGSTFLSSMVSICFGFFLCFLGNIVEGMRSVAASLTKQSTMLLDFTPGLFAPTFENVPRWVELANISIRYLLTGLSKVIPNFERFYASSYLLKGHNVPMDFLGFSAAYFAAYAGIALLIAWLVFRRREMA